MLPESHPLYSAELMLLLLFEKAPPEQYIEFRAIWDIKHRNKPPPDNKKTHIEFAQVKDLEKVFDRVLGDWIMKHNNAMYDVYYGVCPRRSVKRTAKGYAVAGTNEDVSHAVCAWMDYDKSTWKPIIKEKPEPSIVVATGHGAHFYWRYPEAMDIKKAVEDTLVFEKKYGGDPVSDPARILRLPGTRNWKEPEKNHAAAWEGGNIESFFTDWKDVPTGTAKAAKSVYDLNWDLRNVIISGYTAAVGPYEARDPESKEIDRSRVDFRVMVDLLLHDFAEEEIRAIFFNKEYGVSEKTLEAAKAGNADNYFNRTFESARVEHQKRSLMHEEIGDTIEFESWADVRKAPKLEFAVAGVLPVGGMLTISGPAKTGKSLLAGELILRLSGAPGKFLNTFDICKRGRVIYCQAEITRGSLDYRLSVMADAMGYDWRDAPVKFLNRNFNLADPKHVWAVINGIKKEKGDYLFIDPLARFHKEDENKHRDMSMVLSNIERIGREAGVLGTIIVHHFGKPVEGAEREGVQMIRGASVIGDWGNGHVLLRKRFDKVTNAKYVTVSFELRDAEEPNAVDIILDRKTLMFREYKEDVEKLPIRKDIIASFPEADRAMREIARVEKVSLQRARQIYTEVTQTGAKGGNGDSGSETATATATLEETSEIDDE